MLQILKFTYRSERLDFNNGWVSKEAELSVNDTTPDIMEVDQLSQFRAIVDIPSLSDSDNDLDYT